MSEPEEPRVRTVQPSQGARVNVAKCYQAGCIYCPWWGMRFRIFQRAVNQMSRHNAAYHSSEPESP